MSPISNDDLATLCIFSEAANQPNEGKVLIGVVILKRMAERFESDGTVAGTVLAPDQFSGFYFEMRDHVYTRVVGRYDRTGAETRAQVMLAQAKPYTSAWGLALAAWLDAKAIMANGNPAATCLAGPITGWPLGSAFQLVLAEPRALMYDNLKIVTPAWATPDKHVAKIFDHDVYRP